jgi:hypothetical protein
MRDIFMNDIKGLRRIRPDKRSARRGRVVFREFVARLFSLML